MRFEPATALFEIESALQFGPPYGKAYRVADRMFCDYRLKAIPNILKKKLTKFLAEGFFLTAPQTQEGWPIFKVTFKIYLSCVTLKSNSCHPTRFAWFLLWFMQI